MNNGTTTTAYWQDDYYYGTGYHHRPRQVDGGRLCKPLCQQLQGYDDIRLTLEKKGGNREDLENLQNVLSSQISLGEAPNMVCCSLKEPEKIQQGLTRTGGYNLHFEVRRLANGLPCYYLCRLHHDSYLDSSPMIIEEYYRSPGFPVTDQRFIRLLRHGREQFYLNLAPYFKLLDSCGPERDKLLLTIGQEVLQSAWHEDQYPGMMAADLLQLQNFPQAVELLYLILSGDLSALRHSADGKMIGFFKVICPHPAIADFLQHLDKIDSTRLARLPMQARKQYMIIAKGLGDLLRQEISWGSRQGKVELYKVLFGNFSRPHALQDTLRQDEQLQEAAQQLEQTAANIIINLTHQQDENKNHPTPK